MEEIKLDCTGEGPVNSTHDVLHPAEIKKEFPLSSDPHSSGRLMEGAVLEHEDIATQRVEPQIKSESADTKFGSLSNDNCIYIKTESLVSQEADIKGTTSAEDDIVENSVPKVVGDANMYSNQTEFVYNINESYCTASQTKTSKCKPKSFISNPEDFIFTNQQDLPNIKSASQMFRAELQESCCAVQEHAHAQLHVSRDRTELLVTHQTSDQSTKDDLQTLAKEKPFKCSVCAYRCAQKKRLTEHAKIHTGEKPFNCSVCGYRCARKRNLKEHAKIHTGEKPFKCVVCGCNFAYKSSLKGHMKNHTGEKPFKCSVCDYRCRKKSNLKEHEKIHTGEKPFKCVLCDYSSAYKSNMKNHVQNHTGEKPFKCSVCDYKSTRKSNLKEHARIHTGKKPFQCGVCGYSSAYKSSLKDHTKIHTGEKPFKCSVCDYRCVQKCNLKEHMKVHTGEKPFKCGECGYSSAYKSCLKDHVKIHTRVKPFNCSV